MLFFLATPEYNQVQSNTTRIKVHLSSGVAEILEQHQDLMGKIENDLVEIESNFDNKLEKFNFLVQEGVFIVSTHNNFAIDSENSETGVYIYAKRVRELNSKNSLDEIVKDYENKKESLEKEEQKITESDLMGGTGNTKLFLLREEVEFLKKAVSISKELKI